MIRPRSESKRKVDKEIQIERQKDKEIHQFSRDLKGEEGVLIGWPSPRSCHFAT